MQVDVQRANRYVRATAAPNRDRVVLRIGQLRHPHSKEVSLTSEEALRVAEMLISRVAILVKSPEQD